LRAAAERVIVSQTGEMMSDTHLRLFLVFLATAAVFQPTRAVAEQVAEVQPAEQWSALGIVTGFHRVVHKTSGVEIRLLEADGSTSVAEDPVSLFLVASKGATSELVERIWRLPRGVARVRGMTAVACGADVRVDVDVFHANGDTVPGARHATLHLCFLGPDLTLLPTVDVTELGRKKAG
jgi:hypothetical protein